MNEINVALSNLNLNTLLQDSKEDRSAVKWFHRFLYFINNVLLKICMEW